MGVELLGKGLHKPTEWDWSSYALEPYFERLARRCVLLAPLWNYRAVELSTPGRFPTPNGSLPRGHSGLGRCIGIANTSPGTPTDYYQYAGYPTTDATMVPLTLFFICEYDSASSQDHPFMTASNGNGVFFQVDGSGFRPVHGGVVALPYVGTKRANIPMFYAYSYDHATAEQLVYDYGNKSLSTQSTIETRSITTSNQPRIGVKGNFEVMQGNVYMAGWFNFAMTQKEMYRLALDPFGLIRPRSQASVGFVAAAGGGLSIPVAMHHYKQMRAA